MMPSIDLKQRVLEATQTQASRTRAEGRRRSLLVYAIAALAALGVFQFWGGLSHSSARPLRATISIALGALAIAIVASRFSLWRGKTLAGPPRSVLLAVLIAIPLGTLAWLVSFNGSYAEPFQRVGYRCLALSLMTGGVVLTAILVLRRRKQPTNPAIIGGAIGAASAAWGGILVDLWCPLTNAPHVCVGHVSPIILLSCIGAALGQLVLAPRTS